MNGHSQRWSATFSTLVLAGCLALTSGCGTLRDGGSWGRDALYPVQWKRIPQAAKRALLDPGTWLPAVGAAVFTIDDFDQKTADWASANTPIFGSQSAANDASDWLRDALQVEVGVTGLITPSGKDPLEWTWAKAKGVGLEYGAIFINDEVTGLLKNWTGRERPDGNGDNSFPSAHASAAFASARLSNLNLDAIEIRPWARRSLQAGNYLMAGATAWARVEAQRHYPSDVLAGAALGNFISTFFYEAFMNLPEKNRVTWRIEPSRHGVMAGLSYDF